MPICAGVRPSKKPQKFEEFKSEVNTHPYRQCCILDSDLCAFFFVDLQQEGLAITRNWHKVSILPYKQWFDQKTEKQCVFPLGAKKVPNSKSRILTGNFVHAFESCFEELKEKLAKFGITPECQQADNNKQQETIIISTPNKQGTNLSASEIALSLHGRIKAFLSNKDQCLLPIAIRKAEENGVKKRTAGKAYLQQKAEFCNIS